MAQKEAIARVSFIAVVIWLAASGGFALAQSEDFLDDRVLEARAQGIFAQLRCVVCQGQTLASSEAVLAYDMRGRVRTFLSKGESDAEVIDHFVSVYGDSVLLRTPVRGDTLFLWAAPAVIFLAGAGMISWLWRRECKGVFGVRIHAESGREREG